MPTKLPKLISHLVKNVPTVCRASVANGVFPALATHLSRVNFTTIINDDSKEFKYGKYDDDYATVLKPYITNLKLCKGEVKCDKALAMAKRLQQKCTEIALQTEDTTATSHMVAVWTHRGYIGYNEETEMYEKTEKYKMKM